MSRDGPHPEEGEGSDRQPFEHHQLCHWAQHWNNETEICFSQRSHSLLSSAVTLWLVSCQEISALSPNLSLLVVIYKNLWIYKEKGKNRQFSLKPAFNLLQTAGIMTAHIVQGHLFLALYSNYISGKTEILKLKSSEINLFQEKGLEFHFNFFASWGAIQISY